jgi:DNA polymerase III sliding clamp (beta) subunit (PCNA family)
MKIKVTENLKSFVGDITGLNARVPSYYEPNLDRWKDIAVRLHDNNLVIGGGGVDAIMFRKVPIDGKAENFSCSVDKKRFFEAVKFFGKDFSMENEENTYLRLSKSKKTIRLSFSLPDPTIQSLLDKSFDYFGKTEGQRLRIDPEDFDRARQFTSADRSRVSLLNVSLKGNRMRATDGHAMCYIEMKDPVENDVLITQYSPINFNFDTYLYDIKGFYVFANDDTVVFQSKIESAFPNVEKLVEQIGGDQVEFKKKDMLYTLRFLSGMGDGGADIKIEKDRAIIHYVDTYGSGIQDQAGDIVELTNAAGIEQHLRFNLTLIIKVIKNLSFETVKFFIPQEYGKPCYIKEKNNIYIIMPMDKGE